MEELKCILGCGRRIAVFGGVLSLLGPEIETRAEDEENEEEARPGGNPRVSSSGRIECLRLRTGWRGVVTGVGVQE
jgi:hypothetical protein